MLALFVYLSNISFHFYALIKFQSRIGVICYTPATELCLYDPFKNHTKILAILIIEDDLTVKIIVHATHCYL